MRILVCLICDNSQFHEYLDESDPKNQTIWKPDKIFSRNFIVAPQSNNPPSFVGHMESKN
jgi:hypothetical protein